MKRFMQVLYPYFLTVSLLPLIIYLTFITYSVPPLTVAIHQIDAQTFTVVDVDPESHVYNVPIDIGDSILEVGGIPSQDYFNDHLLQDGKYLLPGSEHTLKVKKPGEQAQVVLVKDDWIKHLSSNLFTIQFILTPSFLIIFLSMSVYLWVKKRNEPAVRVLIIFFLLVGMTYYGALPSAKMDIVGGALTTIALPAIPYVFMHFMNLFLQQYKVSFISNKLLANSFIMSTALCTLVWLDRYMSLSYIDGNFHRKLQYVMIIAGYGICLLRLIYLYVQHRKESLHPLFKIFLTVIVISFAPFVIFNVLIPLIFNKVLVSPSFTTFFLIGLPIGYVYLLRSKQLFDIDFIFTRFKRYLFISVIPTVLILVLTALTVELEYIYEEHSLIQIFIIMLFSIVTLLYINEFIANRQGPRLLRNVFNAQDSLDRFSHKVSSAMNHADLEQALGQEITQMMPRCSYQFFDIDPNLAQVNPIPQTFMERQAAKSLIEHMNELRVTELVQTSEGVALVLGHFKNKYRVAWISNKSNHTMFNLDELKWMRTITHYASLVYENLYSVESMMEELKNQLNNRKLTSPWMSRLLFCLSENERRKLASDLHDSALQEQLIWYRKLETTMVDYPMSPEQQRELLAIKEGLLDVIHQIRETCNELRPNLMKELGLVESINHLVEHELLRVNFAIEYNAQPIAAALSYEMMTGVYRIVQELLRNTDKHAQASKAIIELKQDKDSIQFRYKDDGVGMDEMEGENSRIHMGLSGIRERVRSLEGDVQMITSQGQGFEVHIRLPLTLSQDEHYTPYIYMVE